MAYFHGKDVIFFIKVGGVFKPFVCAKDISIVSTAEKISIKTVNSLNHEDWDYGRYGFTINLTSVAKFSDTAEFTSLDFWSYQTAGLKPQFALAFTDTSGASNYFYGRVLIESHTFGVSAGNLAMGDVSLVGCGKLERADALPESCAAEITGVTYDHPSGTVLTLAFAASEDTAYISYTIDGDGGDALTPRSFSGNTYAPLFEVYQSGVFGPGSNFISITAIPYCINDAEGVAFDDTTTMS